MLRVKKSVIVLSSASLILALLGGGKIPYLIFYMISGVFLISFLWTRYVAKRIVAYQKTGSREYYVDDSITIQSYIDNDTILPIPYVEIIDNTIGNMGDVQPRPNIVSMMPTERELVESKTQIKYRGIYDLGPVELRISDVFGAFTWNSKYYSKSFVKVYPRVHHIERFGLKSLQSFGTLSTKNKAYEDNTSVSDIRKYSLGDSVKKIHWKVTAKKGSLHVKNYQLTGSASGYIFLDLKKSCYSKGNPRVLEEKAVETAASLVSYFLSKSVSINMYVNALRLYYTKGRDINELKSFLDILCEVSSQGQKSITEVLEKRVRLMTRGSSIIVITGDATQEDTRIYCSLKKIGYDLVVILVGDEEIDSQVKSTLINSEIKTYFINSNSDIKGVLEE
jgi:uncharacterized protein (DUF58 family)